MVQWFIISFALATFEKNLFYMHKAIDSLDLHGSLGQEGQYTGNLAALSRSKVFIQQSST